MLERCKTCGALTDKRLRPECRLCALEQHAIVETWRARGSSATRDEQRARTLFIEGNRTENTAATSTWLPRGCRSRRVLLSPGFPGFPGFSEVQRLTVWLEVYGHA